MLTEKGVHFLAIEGVIGVGKTTLAKMIAERWNAVFIEENFAENPFLEKFYQNKDAYAFQTQLFFLLDRHKQLQNSALQSDLFHDLLVSDYTFDKDQIFAAQNLENDSEYAMYEAVSKALSHDMPKPDLVVYLQASVPTLLSRVRSRGRSMEKSIEDAIGDYVDVNLVMFEGGSDVYYSSFYDIPTGHDNSIDFSFGAGWGPDYGDPLTYINCYNIDNGDMLHYSGLDLTREYPSESNIAAKKAIGLEETQAAMDDASASVGDERIEKFAKVEAMLLTNGILRPYSTSGANLAVSKVKPFSAAYGLYGQAAYNAIPYFKYMQLLEEPVTADEYYAAKEAWLAGE
mgnify:CR=1 FL=1